MIVTTPRDWAKVIANLESVDAHRVFLVGCGECATTAHTGGEPELIAAAEMLAAAGYEVSGSTVTEITCHAAGAKLDMRKHADEIAAADAVLVFSCGAGVQSVADVVTKPVFPALESAFLGTIVRNGVFEERCQMCGECVLDQTAGICPVTTCPKGLLNGPCGGMWNGMCEVLPDRECAHVRIRRRLAEQGRTNTTALKPRDFSHSLKPGAVNLRTAGGSAGKGGRQ